MSSDTPLLDQMIAVLQAAKVDDTKLREKGNDSAGRRVRAAMQEIKKLAQAVRVEVLAVVKKDE